jgi:hypothetical protein
MRPWAQESGTAMKKYVTPFALAAMMTVTTAAFASGPGDGDPPPSTPPVSTSSTTGMGSTGVVAAILTLLGM